VPELGNTNFEPTPFGGESYTNDYCCIGKVTARFTVFLDYVPDMSMAKLTHGCNTIYESDCVDLPCTGEGWDANVCQKTIDAFNKAHDPKNAVITGTGLDMHNPLVFTLERWTKIGCCANPDCPSIFRSFTSGQHLVDGQGSYTIYGPVTDAVKLEAKRVAMSYWWFGGTGSIGPTPPQWRGKAASWANINSCCRDEWDAPQRGNDRRDGISTGDELY